MPTTNDENMSGTINILIKLMNSEPIGLMYSAEGPSTAPTTTPNINAIMIFCQSFKLVQNPNGPPFLVGVKGSV
jgi:hypothetical protein